MFRLLEPCCSLCRHSAERPCPDLIACVAGGPKCHENIACSADRAERFDRASGARLDRPAIHIGVGTCGIAAGAQEVWDVVAAELAARKLDADLVSVGCIGYCEKEVLLDIEMPEEGRVFFANVTPEIARTLVRRVLAEGRPAPELALGWIAATAPKGYEAIPKLTDLPFYRGQVKIVLERCGITDPENLDAYLATGGYQALAHALKDMSPERIIGEVSTSGLRGRGGAGFPTGQKWKFARAANGDRKFVVCNADEGDPGAFMNRSVLESDPHRVIEGMIIGAYAMGAHEGFVHIRVDFALAVERVGRAIKEAESAGLLGENILGSGFSFHLEMKRCAGAYVCGEETALMASIESLRGMPRPRPPFPAQSGLWGCPTNINNVETWATIPPIVNRGGAWYASIGTEGSKGTKVFALTGKVANTGLIEVPMGTPIREVIFSIGGGIPEGKRFKAVQLGGPSGGCVPESLLDTPIDYEAIKKTGAIMGSGIMVVMDETNCMVDIARYFASFAQAESCGKCIPCREGTKRMLEILERIAMTAPESSREDQLARFEGAMLLERLATVISQTSLCGLGQSAPNPVLSTLRHFRDEYEAHVYDLKCPAGVCGGLLSREEKPVAAPA